MRVRRTRPLRNTSLLRPDDSAGNGCSDDVPMSVVSRRWVPQHRRSLPVFSAYAPTLNEDSKINTSTENVDSHIHQSVTSIKTSDAFPTPPHAICRYALIFSQPDILHLSKSSDAHFPLRQRTFSILKGCLPRWRGVSRDERPALVTMLGHGRVLSQDTD
ncbi:hypothetical protein EVAR_99131_1 [Eumeta japonica]|uniref:Uncharacterized protein n=1 Tax=Eumeta variegata TaxID=151549 RepID=A0A4C1YRL5_EUMVA|nr:hypothetical protein EVAR_99131_1 [Eumeta japonica]